MKILIYGLGKEALTAVKCLKKEHELIGFTDSFSEIKNYANYPYIARKDINNIDFDYIILALRNRTVSEQVKDELIAEGVNLQKIIDFMHLFTRQKVDKVMCRSKGEKIDGLILGISHAIFGINPAYLSFNWKNLAMTHEDLYYHYMVLKKCTDYYADIIGNLKYAIIDLYDYTVFKYDLSLTKGIFDYWALGGYAEDSHHFYDNVNFSNSIEEETRKRGIYLPVVTSKELQLSEQLFDMNMAECEMEHLYVNSLPGNDGFRDYPEQIKLDKIIPEEPLLPYNLFYMGWKRYPETVEENINILNKLIILLKQVNPRIKIYFLLMPRFGNMEKYHAMLLHQERKEFEDIMNIFLKEENCYYFNFKKCPEIYNNRHFFWDVAHLNYMGAIAFTGILNECIRKTL